MNNIKPIILFGFKHVGKSTLGELLAEKLQRPFFDLDKEVEKAFCKQFMQSLSVREIIQQHGSDVFNRLENKLLMQLLQKTPDIVLAVGGGTLIKEENQILVKNTICIHITAPKEQVLERIILNGRPIFFSPNQSMQEAFDDLWEKRIPIYEGIAEYSLHNNGDIKSTIEKIIPQLMAKKILLLHGPNLNKLGQRDKTHYGTLSLFDIEQLTIKTAKNYHLDVRCFQSNHEGQLIDCLQTEAANSLGIIINPGALAHYSYALHDALLDTQLPIVEVHLSDINQRESWRQHSVTAAACIKVISGKKEHGYIEAVTTLIENLNNAN